MRRTWLRLYSVGIFCNIIALCDGSLRIYGDTHLKSEWATKPQNFVQLSIARCNQFPHNVLFDYIATVIFKPWLIPHHVARNANKKNKTSPYCVKHSINLNNCHLRYSHQQITWKSCQFLNSANSPSYVKALSLDYFYSVWTFPYKAFHLFTSLAKYSFHRAFKLQGFFSSVLPFYISDQIGFEKGLTSLWKGFGDL